MFLESHGGYVRVSRRDVSHALPPDEFGGHYELLGRKIRLLDSAQRELGQMNAELLGKFAYACQPRMQDFANGVIETGDANVFGYPDSRLLQCLIYAGSGLIGADKQRGGPFAAGQQGLYGKISQFAVFRTDLAETRLEISFFHSLAITASAPRKPWQALVSDIPDVAMTLGDEIASDIRGAAYVVGEDAIVLFRLPVTHNVIAHKREGNFRFAESGKDVGRVRTAQNNAAGAV